MTETARPLLSNSNHSHNYDFEAEARQSGQLSSLQAICADLHAQIAAFLQEDVPTERLKTVQTQTRISLGIIQEALKRFGLPALSLSYNGGKDCLVLLVLYLSCLHRPPHHSTSTSECSHTSQSSYRLASINNVPTPPSLSAFLESIYIQSSHPFPEVDKFVTSSSAIYHLSLTRFTRESMKAAFEAYLEEKPQIKAIFVGTRRTDPHGGKLTHFDKTDRGWPEFMRIHPVIDWRYADIWVFIRHLKIPYCELYDQGYTSLGGTTDTHPNPALRSEREGHYRPAYELEVDEEERLGRDK